MIVKKTKKQKGFVDKERFLSYEYSSKNESILLESNYKYKITLGDVSTNNEITIDLKNEGIK